MNSESIKKGVGKITRLVPQVKTHEPISGVLLSAVKTGVLDIITLTGSMPASATQETDECMRVRVLAEMLMEGTKRHSKEAFHQALESRGIHLSFCSDHGSLRFVLQTLTDEFKTGLAFLTEALFEPAFTESAFVRTKKRLHGEFEQLLFDTHDLAYTRFNQLLYPRSHCNSMASIPEALTSLEKVSRQDLLRVKNHYGRGHIKMAAVGDLRHETLSREIAQAFEKIGEGKFAPHREKKHPLTSKKIENTIAVPGKASIDVFVGAALPITRAHPDYYPLALAASVLGSGFTGRLMRHVRDRDGLTYCTYARLAGFSHDAEGFWYAYASFAPEFLARGRESLTHELNEFSARGITEEELLHQKTKIAGEHTVSLGTTEGLAHAILGLLEENLPLALLDDYPAEFAKLSLEDVNAVVAKYLDSRVLALVASGTFPPQFSGRKKIR